MSAMNIEIETEPFNVLLPVCIETKTDVFLIILKNHVARDGRSKLDDHYLVNAFMSGMSEEQFSIEAEDISADWTKLDSESQQIRQWKLLGLWTVNNFPSLLKKLLGKSYRVPKGNVVPVNWNTAFKADSPDSIDEFIFPKMKLRNIELKLAESTMIKLKHFTKFPGFIGKSKEDRISRKMKSFDVDDEFVERCWKALKTGEFSINLDFENQVQTIAIDDGSYDTAATTGENAIRPGQENDTHNYHHDQDCERDNDRVHTINAHKDGYPNSDFRTAPSAKRVCLESDSVLDSHRGLDNDRGLDSDRDIVCRINTHTDVDSNSGSLREIILQMRDEIRMSTKPVEGTGSERLHEVINRKDEEICQNETTMHQLQSAIQILKTSESNLIEKLKTETAAKVELEIQIQDLREKIAEADKQLNERNRYTENKEKESCEWKQNADSKEELNVHLRSQIQDLSGALAERDKELNKWKQSNVESETQIQDVKGKIAEAEKQLNEWKRYTESKEKESCEWKQYADSKEELNVHLRSQIQNLSGKLVETDKELNKWKQSNVELETQIQDLSEKIAEAEKQLNEWKRYTESKEKESCEWKQNAVSKEELNVHLKSQIQDLSGALAERDKELNEWKQYAAIKDNEVIAANIKNGAHQKLQGELTALRNRSDGIVAKLRNHIESLDKDSAVVDAENSDLKERNAQLEQQLSVLKKHAASKCEENQSNKNAAAHIKMERKKDDNEQSESSGCVSIDDILIVEECESSGGVLHGKKSTDDVLSGTEAERIETDDAKFLNFLQLRNHLKSLKFGWMKFYTFKNSLFLPGFVHPADTDGKCRAQSVKPDGTVICKKKHIFRIFKKCR